MANITYIKGTMKFPTEKDLNGAAVALIRLQNTYRLDSASLARGELNGVKYSSELSASDCFELGRQSYNNRDNYHALSWLREAYFRLKREVDEIAENRDVLASFNFKQDNLPLALDLIDKLLEISPPLPLRNLGEKLFHEEELQKNLTGDSRNKDDVESQTMDEDEVDLDEHKYYKLCRGEILLLPEKGAKLKCRYSRPANNPFLLLAPFKVEEAHHDPHIFIYHDVLGDSEIVTIKKLAQPRFRRATVRKAETGEPEIVRYRISKFAWLDEKEHKHVADVSQRVSDITGLTMMTAEQLQVVKYGIGGHYKPHFDFVRKDKIPFKNLEAGNRIATVLFYMSDVAQGGATVFTHIGVTLWPKKGTATFWHNLHPRGDGDRRTKHAACPVLEGSKWSKIWNACNPSDLISKAIFSVCTK